MENELLRKAAVKLASWMNQYAYREGLELRKLEIGIEFLLINTSKIIIIYTLAALLGILWQSFVLHLAFVIAKRYSFGVHALNSTVCTLISCLMFVASPLLLDGLGINNHLVIISFTAVIYILYLYAPADTKARPLIGVGLRAGLKRRAVASGITLMLVALLIPSEPVKLLLTLGALYQSVSILPITYKFLKRSERNYEAHEGT